MIKILVLELRKRARQKKTQQSKRAEGNLLKYHGTLIVFRRNNKQIIFYLLPKNPLKSNSIDLLLSLDVIFLKFIYTFKFLAIKAFKGNQTIS